MDFVTGLHDETATLAWVIGAFEHVLEHDQTKLVPYMIEVCEELVFQMELPNHLSALRARYQLQADLQDVAKRYESDPSLNPAPN